ncbi:MAG: hypothetical protein FWD78_08805 [Treponema sp.]|nr:hypothetical protein [Treponema sp.]
MFNPDLFNPDPAKVPFSRYGSYMAISGKPHNADDTSLYLKNIRGVKEGKYQFRFCFDGDYTVEFKPWRLSVRTRNGELHAYFRGSNELVLYGNMKNFRMEYVNSGNDGYLIGVKKGRSLRAVDRSSKSFGFVYAHEGSVELKSRWGVKPPPGERLFCAEAFFDVTGSENGFTLLYRVEEIEELWNQAEIINPEFDIELIKTEFKKWESAFPVYDDRYQEISQIMIYILWSSAVFKKGWLTRDAVYMSKGVMTGVWSWDNCFNAMALAPYHYQTGMDQILVMLENQIENGKLPDRLDDRDLQAIYTKPPVYGWSIMHILDAGAVIDQKTLKFLRDCMVKMLSWWERLRDDDHDGICQYNHGNECGWDNSTAFDMGVPVESPDLPALMLLQMKAIVRISRLINDDAAAAEYENRYNKLNKIFLEHCFDKNDLPVPVLVQTGEKIKCLSLLPYVSIILGKLLPQNIFEKMKTIIEDKNLFFAPYGLASEAVSSKKFARTNAYWRGPAWGPMAYQIADGLRQGVADGLAR